MKTTISILLVIICTVVLTAQEGQAKKGCNAYGHVCYGGHGKRSLSSNEQDDLRPNAIIPIFANDETAISTDNELSAYPKYRLIKLIQSWFRGHSRHPLERFNDIDYAASTENMNRDMHNSFN